MSGVRGFSDPNVQVNSGGSPVWEQAIDPSVTDANYLLPWYLNYQGGSFLNATQCMYDNFLSYVLSFLYYPAENLHMCRVAGDNGWQDNHAALNGGLNNHWATNNTPWSWGHFQRGDIPVQFAIAEGWTVGDMYQVGGSEVFERISGLPTGPSQELCLFWLYYAMGLIYSNFI